MRFRIPCNKIFFVLSLFISLPSLAQKTEKFYDYNWKECEPNYARFYGTMEKTDSGYLANDYFIHEKKIQMRGLYQDAGGKVKNGTFYTFHSNGELKSVVKYSKGKLDGLYLEFHPNGMLADSSFYTMGYQRGTSLSWNQEGYMIDSTVLNDDLSGTTVHWFDDGSPSYAGRYTSARRMTGKWIYHHKNGKTSSLETYDEGILIDKQYFDETGAPMQDTTNKDHPASFPGGDEGWKKYTNKKMYYPRNFDLVNGDKAVVVVDFVINENGEVSDIFTSTPFYPDFDRIAEKAIKNSPKWNPAVSHNRKVKSYRRQAVHFNQEQ